MDKYTIRSSPQWAGCRAPAHKGGDGLCLTSDWQPLDSISLPEGHLSCPTKAKTKAVSATASPTWSVVVRGVLALSCAHTQGSSSGSRSSGTKASSIYRGNRVGLTSNAEGRPPSLVPRLAPVLGNVPFCSFGYPGRKLYLVFQLQSRGQTIRSWEALSVLSSGVVELLESHRPG